jgi:hypothetical protein
MEALESQSLDSASHPRRDELFNYAATALAVINSFQSRFFSALPPSDLSTKLFTINKNVASEYYIEPITD